MRKVVSTRWLCDLTGLRITLEELTRAVNVVQPEERERLMKFHFIDDFMSSLVGRLMMRKFVAENSALPYRDIQFARDVRGKPYLLPPQVDGVHIPQLSFNVSHHVTYVVLAGVVVIDDVPDDLNFLNANYSSAADNSCGSKDFSVGVDIMRIKTFADRQFLSFIQQKFSGAEIDYVTQVHHNHADRMKAFMRLWCLKEAYVKALGVGITVNLKQISFEANSDIDTLNVTLEKPLTCARLKVDGLAKVDWLFEEQMVHPRYCTAVAYYNCVPTALERFQLVSGEQLLSQAVPTEDDEILSYCRAVMRKPEKSSFS